MPPDIAAHVHDVRLLRQQTRATTYTTRDGKKWQDLEKLIQRNALHNLHGSQVSLQAGIVSGSRSWAVAGSLARCSKSVLTGIIYKARCWPRMYPQKSSCKVGMRTTSTHLKPCCVGDTRKFPCRTSGKRRKRLNVLYKT